MKHLYVLGNGFDIAHKLSSRYSDFRYWLKENNPEVYDLMVEYFPDVAEDNVEWWVKYIDLAQSTHIYSANLAL